ncbi:hypothetical protein WISP_04013 [Willisornis vidua]|uniref:Interleukin-2 receptor subunit alpha n=1 Tax=Willisornis vidua TaxID=1566151 RepID=A0ABQ9DZ31_9PASS|nr:hypothetical protein WISP_04013 [Willisornis vidua]
MKCQCPRQVFQCREQEHHCETLSQRCVSGIGSEMSQISKHFERAKSSDKQLGKLRHEMVIDSIKIKLCLSAKGKKSNADFLVKIITFVSFTLHSSSAQEVQAWMRLGVRGKHKTQGCTLIHLLLSNMIVFHVAHPLDMSGIEKTERWTELYYECDSGYDRISGTHPGIKCKREQQGASWTYSGFKCIDFCGPPKALPHASLKVKKHYYVGQELHFKCQSGYDKRPPTSGTSTCKKVNGIIIWTPLDMQCTNDSSKWPAQTVETEKTCQGIVAFRCKHVKLMTFHRRNQIVPATPRSAVATEEEAWTLKSSV